MFAEQKIANQSKHLRIPGLGTVKITRKRKCKRLCIRVNPGKDIKVTIPFRTSFHEGEKFVFEKIDWIRNAIEKLSINEGLLNSFTVNYKINTRTREIKVQVHDNEKFVLRLLKNEALILVPNNINLSTNQVQETIKNMVVEALRNEAKEYLPLRTLQLAQKNSLNISGVRVKNTTSRWGSCSANNNINLNIHLIRLPDELSDFIILHELAHTLHKNHGPRFWDKLEQLAGNAKEKTKQLKHYKLGLFE